MPAAIAEVTEPTITTAEHDTELAGLVTAEQADQVVPDSELSPADEPSEPMTQTKEPKGFLGRIAAKASSAQWALTGKLVRTSDRVAEAVAGKDGGKFRSKAASHIGLSLLGGIGMYVGLRAAGALDINHIGDMMMASTGHGGGMAPHAVEHAQLADYTTSSNRPPVGQNPTPASHQPVSGHKVTLLDARETHRLDNKSEFAGHQPDVAPNDVHALHFTPDEHGKGLTAELVGMKKGGTTINGHNITEAQMRRMQAVVTINIKGHHGTYQETIVVSAPDGKLHLPAKLAHLVEGRHFDSFQMMVPGRHESTAVSTVFGNGHSYSARQVAKHVAQLDTYQQNHGAQTAQVPAPSHKGNGNSAPQQSQQPSSGQQDVLKTNIVADNPANATSLRDSDKYLFTGLPVNDLSAGGNHGFYTELPKGDVYIGTDHYMYVNNHGINVIDDNLEHHGLVGTFTANAQQKVTHLEISPSTANTADLQFPAGSHLVLSADHKTMFITLPNHARPIEVDIQHAVNAKGDINFGKAEGAITEKLAKRGWKATFSPEHVATVTKITQPAPSNSPTPTSTPTQTPSPSPTVTSPAPQPSVSITYPFNSGSPTVAPQPN